MVQERTTTQMVLEPTIEKNILDLFLINNPTLVDTVRAVSGISDHQAIVSVVKHTPFIQTIKPRTTHLFSKADWASVRQEMEELQSSFLSSCEGENIDHLWK